MYQIKARKNKTNLFVRDCITKALFQLLKNKEFEDISVSDIIKRAGVSRMGFYRNFSSKENVVEEYILDIFVETVEDIKSKRNLNFAIKNIISTSLENFVKYADIIELFLDKKLDNLLYNCYCRAYYTLNQDRTNSRIHEYSSQMFIGELFNLEMCWIRNGMKETPEQLTKIYFKILKLRSEIK